MFIYIDVVIKTANTNMHDTKNFRIIDRKRDIFFLKSKKIMGAKYYKYFIMWPTKSPSCKKYVIFTNFIIVVKIEFYIFLKCWTLKTPILHKICAENFLKKII